MPGQILSRLTVIDIVKEGGNGLFNIIKKSLNLLRKIKIV